MKDESRLDHLPGESAKDAVEAARDLTELLMGIIPTELAELVRHPPGYKNQERNQIFRAFYDSLTSEQKEAIRDKDRRLHYTDLTIDQQVYLKQAFHQMWMWSIAGSIIRPPFYIRTMEECKFFMEGKPEDGRFVMKIFKYSPAPPGYVAFSGIFIPFSGEPAH